MYGKRCLSFRSAPAAALLTVALTALLAATPARSQLSLASLNCLHLGQGKPAYQLNKEAILKIFLNGYDVVLLQEVMRQADLADVTPGAYRFLVSNLQGKGTYKEAYGFLVRATLPSTNVYYSDVLGFSRTPAGILVDSNGVGTWLINYHAIFGVIKDRRDEVRLMRQVYQDFQNTQYNGQNFSRAVIGGDWNLGANDQAFADLSHGWPISVQPNVQTSLKRNGDPSQPYDHFLWDTTAVNVTSPAVIAPPGPAPGWRQQVSDHLGISCVVN